MNREYTGPLHYDRTTTITKRIDENGNEIEDAVVKIQAGVRGYLVRKQMSNRSSPSRTADMVPENNVASAIMTAISGGKFKNLKFCLIN